ncbi:MAG: hypothetical protein DMF94_03285 [Acidobacteria bacterium]|nr:MAG: hypothetical protein DMF94_03285 [Acidobacteriota bacterium]
MARKPKPLDCAAQPVADGIGVLCKFPVDTNQVRFHRLAADNISRQVQAVHTGAMSDLRVLVQGLDEIDGHSI